MTVAFARRLLCWEKRNALQPETVPRAFCVKDGMRAYGR
jgi:hypothetical protein